MPLNELAPLLMAERLTVAALIGAAVGTEREWSGPTVGPQRRFAGLRTFLLFGILGGIAGLLLEIGAILPGSIVLAAGLAFNVVAYAMSVRRPEQPLDGTTEAAALVVLGLGALSGLGYLTLAAGSGAVVVFALGQKQRLHWLVRRIGEVEMRAALEFLVLALVILPLLPTGPYESLWGFRPRELWGIVVLLSGINFAGYLARRAVGPGRGYGITGALAGLISSTVLTLQFARISRAEPQHARALSLGVIAACTLLPVRILVVSLVLNPGVALQLLYYLIPAVVVGAIFTALLMRDSTSVEAPAPEPRNPLRLATAVQLALIIEVTFLVMGYARSVWGTSGLTGSSILFGVTDMDALTVSLSRRAGDAVLASRGIGIGLLTNTISKLLLAIIVGDRNFRRLTAGGLMMTAVVLAGVLWWRW